MALYMVQNDLDEQSVITDGYKLDFPESVVSFFKGEMGQPVNGFNKDLQAVILKGQEALTARPGEYLEPVDFEKSVSCLKKSNKVLLRSKILLVMYYIQKYMNNIFKLEINTETYRYLIRLHSSLECVMVKQ